MRIFISITKQHECPEELRDELVLKVDLGDITEDEVKTFVESVMHQLSYNYNTENK